MRAKTILALGIFLLAILVTAAALLKQASTGGGPEFAVEFSEDVAHLAQAAMAERDPSLCVLLPDPAQRATCIAKAIPTPSVSTFAHASAADLERAAVEYAVAISDPSLCLFVADDAARARCFQGAS